MKYYLQLSLAILFFSFLTSCKGQKKTEVVQQPINPTEAALSDYDPYFQGTKTVSTSHGPTSITRNILQDKSGTIWLATWDGIIRYDGTSFVNMTNKEGLKRFRTFVILEDRKGNIWFGTIGAGVYCFNGKTFTNFTTNEGLVNDSVTNIYEDTKGNLWFGTQGGASCFDGKSFHNITTKEGLCDNDLNTIIQDESGKFWFATRGDACHYDARPTESVGRGESFTNFTKPNGEDFENIRCIIKDKKGAMWLGGNDGLWRFKDGAYTNYATEFVGYIYEDRAGNIWTSSEAGSGKDVWALSRYDEKSLENEKVIPTQILKERDMFFGILEDSNGGIWLGSLDGVCRYDGISFDYFREEDIKE